jgi:hypothetical protein
MRSKICFLAIVSFWLVMNYLPDVFPALTEGLRENAVP